MTAAPTVRMLINARWIIPVVPSGRVFERCSLVVQGRDIIAILPWEEAARCYRAEQTINLYDHVLIPGLINAHGHAAMSLLRGYAEDLPSAQWQQERIGPTETRHLSPDFVADGTELAMVEMIKAGTTCFADLYPFPEEVAKKVHRAHIRAQIAFPVSAEPNAWARGSDECIEKGLALRDAYRGDELISVVFGAPAPASLDEPTIKKIAVLAQELDTGVHLHLHETAAEVADSVRQHGLRPSERLQQLGLLSEQTRCVHMTQVDDTDINLLQQTGAKVIHCPTSNLKLANGFCPLARLLAADITVALGTAGAASSNDLSLLEELHTAALLGKAVANDATALDAHTCLQMATLAGAQALGLDARTGSLEPGKAADIVALDLSATDCSPIYDPAVSLVHNNRAAQVTHVWMDGKALMLSGHLQTLNEREIRGKTEHWRTQLAPTF